MTDPANLMAMSKNRPPSTDRRRLLLGVAVLCLAAAAALAWWNDASEMGSVLLRADILLAGVWLAYPSLRSMRWGVVLAVTGGGILLLTRWRLVAAMILIALAVGLFWGRIRKRSVR